MKKKLKEKFIIIVYGPTAVGKSSFAEKLARKIPSQIVNCDIGQFYTPLTIGTAKPDWRTSDIKHQLFDIIDEPRYFNVSEYRDILFKTVEKIWTENEIPILVGGSGFYLKSLFFPPIPKGSISIESTEGRENMSDAQLWETLNKIDSQRAARIKQNDRYRVERALDIWKTTGKKPSDFLPIYNFPNKFLFLFLTRDREQLYKRVNDRVFQMIDEGWIDEVKGLMGTKWEKFLKGKKIIGYDLIIDYLKEPDSHKPDKLDKLIVDIQKKTRNYAKRQITFWKSFEKELKREIESFKSKNKDLNFYPKTDLINLTLLDLDLYISQLLNNLNHLFE